MGRASLKACSPSPQVFCSILDITCHISRHRYCSFSLWRDHYQHLHFLKSMMSEIRIQNLFRRLKVPRLLDSSLLVDNWIFNESVALMIDYYYIGLLFWDHVIKYERKKITLICKSTKFIYRSWPIYIDSIIALNVSTKLYNYTNLVCDLDILNKQT